MKYNLVKPQIDENEINSVEKVLKSGMLAESKVSRKFEKEFASFVGTKHAIVTSSGTTALQLTFEALGLPVGTEVITSAFTFIASANSVVLAGGIPIFADIDQNTFNLDPEKVKNKITDKTKAIMPVHIFGLPADMKAYKEIAEDYDLFLIEDAAQAHGSKIGNKHVGSFGDAGCFSLYASKNMVSGEGGIITTNSTEVADNLDSLKNHGRGKQGGYSHYRIGYNFRLTDFASAMALEQLKKLPKMVEQRKNNHTIVRDILEPHNELIEVQKIPDDYTHSNYVLAPVIKKSSIKVENVIKELIKNDIGARTIYSIPVYQQPAYENINSWKWAKFIKYPDYSKVSLPITERIAQSHFEIPANPSVDEEGSKFIAETLIKILKQQS